MKYIIKEFVCLLSACLIWDGTFAYSLNIRDDFVDNCINESFESAFDACKEWHLTEDGQTPEKRYWSEQLVFINNLNIDIGNAECLKWYKFYDCVLSSTNCVYSTVLQMVHLRNPSQGHDFYTAFYERNCEGDHLKADVQSLLSLPSPQIASCTGMISALSAYSYPEAIDCIREMAENPAWSDQHKLRALHIADLITPPWYSPESYFVAGNNGLCTIGFYGEFYVKHCDTARMIMCPWMSAGMPDTLLFEDDRLRVTGMLYIGHHRNHMIMMSLLQSFKIEFKTAKNEIIAIYINGYYHNLPATFTNNKTTAGEGTDTVHLHVANDMVELLQPGRGIYIVGKNFRNGYSLVMRMPREVAYHGEILKTWSDRCTTNHGTDFSIQKLKIYGLYMRNHTLGQYLDQCLQIKSAAMRDVCRSDAVRYLFYSNPANSTKLWYYQTVLVESQDLILSQYQSNSALFPRPRPAPTVPATSVLPFPQVQKRASPVPCTIPSEDLSMALKSCYWIGCRAVQPDVYELLAITELVFNPRHWPLTCSDNLLALIHNCVMAKSLCSSEVVSTLIESEYDVEAEGRDSQFRRLICQAGGLSPEITELLNEPASVTFNVTLALEECAAKFSRFSYGEAFRDRYLSMMFLCATSAIQQSGWSLDKKQLAINIVKLILPPGMTPEETEEMVSPFYDFKLPRCTVGVYGDPHIRMCNDSRLVTCSLAGRNIYLLSPFFRIDGVNTIVPGRSRRPQPTTLTSFVLSVASLDTPYQFVEIYRTEAGVLPWLFTNGDSTWGTTEKDRIMIAGQNPNHVEIVHSYLGMVIRLNVLDGDYFFSLRVAKTVISPSVGLLSTGCTPPFQIIDRTQAIGRRSRRDANEDRLAEAEAACVAVPDDDLKAACVYDVMMTGNSKFAKMATNSLLDIQAIELDDNERIMAAGHLKVDTVTVPDVIITQQRCRSLLSVEFNEAVADLSGERSWIDNKGVEAVENNGTIDRHAGYFGNGAYFKIDRFSYGYFGSNLKLSVRFQSEAGDGRDMDQVLMSNGEQGLPSIEIVYNPDQGRLTASLQTLNRHGRLTIHANASVEWLTVDYLYTGEVFMLRASSNNVLIDQQYIHFNGTVATVASSLYIGGLRSPADGQTHFNGLMDSVKLDICGGL